MSGLTASSRASAEVAASFADTFFDLTRAARSAADRRQRSCMMGSVWTCRLLAARQDQGQPPVRKVEPTSGMRSLSRLRGRAGVGVFPQSVSVEYRDL